MFFGLRHAVCACSYGNCIFIAHCAISWQCQKLLANSKLPCSAHFIVVIFKFVFLSRVIASGKILSSLHFICSPHVRRNTWSTNVIQCHMPPKSLAQCSLREPFDLYISSMMQRCYVWQKKGAKSACSLKPSWGCDCVLSITSWILTTASCCLRGTNSSTNKFKFFLMPPNMNTWFRASSPKNESSKPGMQYPKRSCNWNSYPI